MSNKQRKLYGCRYIGVIDYTWTHGLYLYKTKNNKIVTVTHFYTDDEQNKEYMNQSNCPKDFICHGEITEFIEELISPRCWYDRNI